MIRRFETYAFVPGATDYQRRELARVVAEAGHYIPEVVHGAAGWNRSGSDAELVWEHAYESVAAYRRYMVHRYHAEVLDRYVLVDSPERVVEPVRGAGLFGYECEGTPYLLERGARRVVLLQVERAARAAETAALERRLHEATSKVGGVLSVWGVNTMANRWFDGVTALAMPVHYTHVWEQGFRSMDELERFPVSDFLGDPIVRKTSELVYEVAL